MSPRRVVAILLEADDMLPPEQGIDVKSLTSRATDGTPLPVPGVPITGLHRDWSRRFEQKRLRRDGPTEFFKVDNNTLLVRDIRDGSIAVKFHYTDILTVTPDDTLTLNNGTWQTVTTLSRINNWLPGGWGLYSQKGTWYWQNHRHSDEDMNPGFKRTQPYSNGDMITADGTLHPKAGPEFKRTRVPQRRDL